jgi:predicted lipoprotein with Yx(FWY)xxD motif
MFDLKKQLGLALALLMLFGWVPLAAAQGPATVQVAEHPALGKILTDGQGMTLYLFTKDAANVSNCYDQCAVTWPPLLVAAGAQPTAAEGVPGQLGVIERTDGSRQVTYNGQPLYFFIKDSKFGDTTGQGVGGVWFVVNPADTAMAATAATPPATMPETGGALTLSLWASLLLLAAGSLVLGGGLVLALARVRRTR